MWRSELRALRGVRTLYLIVPNEITQHETFTLQAVSWTELRDQYAQRIALERVHIYEDVETFVTTFHRKW